MQAILCLYSSERIGEPVLILVKSEGALVLVKSEAVSVLVKFLILETPIVEISFLGVIF